MHETWALGSPVVCGLAAFAGLFLLAVALLAITEVGR